MDNIFIFTPLLEHQILKIESFGKSVWICQVVSSKIPVAQTIRVPNLYVGFKPALH